MTDPLSRDGLERFADVAAHHVGSDKIPGLVALVSRDDQVHVETLGSLSVGGTPVSRDSQFRIASTSKPVTGAAIMTLVDEGVVRLEDPVERWLPELAHRRVLRRMDGPLDDTVPAPRPITVLDLLTFTFGFGMVAEMFMAARPWPVVQAATDLHLCTLGPPNPDEQPDPDSWIAGLGSLPLMAEPGRRWMYNTGASVLGVLAGRAAGIPFTDVVRGRIFEPLGMRDTAFWASDVSRLATAYVSTADGLQVWDPPDGQWSHPPAFADGAAGLVSTADDLLAFARMFLAAGAPVLSEEAVAQMTRDQLTPAQRAGTADAFLHGRTWGLCQSVITDGPRSGAFGWDGGLGTSWLVDPARALVVIVLTQRLWATSEPPALHVELQDAAYAALTNS
ncbi:MAG: serine hydrolase domain-containing protein [Acidimicrobiales bacterium]|jgi:CubicO group peptidase (beta-lactamase class C family)